jgi:hypothetical protein
MTHTIHHLKTWPRYWDAIAAGVKTFELRRNDRFFQRDDIVVLHRFAEPRDGNCYIDPHGTTSSFPLPAGALTFLVGPILQADDTNGLRPGFCIFSLLPPPPDVACHGSPPPS